MEVKELIGRWVVRTGPVDLGGGVFDHSFTTSQILIVNVTESHIVYKHKLFKDINLLDARWLDDKWVDYSSLFPIISLEGGGTDER